MTDKDINTISDESMTKISGLLAKLTGQGADPRDVFDLFMSSVQYGGARTVSELKRMVAEKVSADMGEAQGTA